MAININSTSNSVKEIKFTSASVAEADVTKLLLNGTTVWAKPFTLYVNLGSGVSRVQVVKTSKTDPITSNTYTLTSSGSVPVYYGETIEIAPTATSNYTLSGTWPQTINIIENISITINATTTQSQLLPVEVIDGFYSYLEEERRATLCAEIINPNNIDVNIDYRLFNISYNTFEGVMLGSTTTPASANSDAQVLIDDYNNKLGFKDWADPDLYHSNGALIAMRCVDPNYNNQSYQPSYWRFYAISNTWGSPSTGGNIGTLNNVTNKLPSYSSVTASYELKDNLYSVHLSPTGYWPLPFKKVITTPNGIYEFADDESIVLDVDSLDAVVQIQRTDLTSLGFEPSDVTSFNLADAHEATDNQS